MRLPKIFRRKYERTPLSHEGWTRLTSGATIIPPGDTFSSVFPYANAIAGRFSTIIPYAVDSEGREITPAPQAVKALYAPNSQFSCLEFLKFIALSILTQPHLDILIWTRDENGFAMPGGHVTPDNIVGYTFLPADSREYDASRTSWINRAQVNDGRGLRSMTFTRREVISLAFARHPLDPTRGISPAQTVRKWANVDDMLADYQRGFFGNGAVPAGMMSIVAGSAEDFERTKSQIERNFQGAANTNSVLYSMVPVDPLSGKPSDQSKLTWTPFQSANNTLDLNTLDGIVNSRLASAMAVPDIIRGLDTGQTYANAEQAERSFIENTLKPLCMTVWDKWQFELDRITGGLGYGLNFQLDLPAQTDVRKVQVDTQAVQVDTLIKLVNAGASVESAVHALGLSDDWKNLDLSQQTPTLFTRDPAPTAPAPVQLLRAENTDNSQPTRKDEAIKTAREALQNWYLARIAKLSHGEYARKMLSDDEDGSIDAVLIDQLTDSYRAQIVKEANGTGKSVLAVILEKAKTDPTLAQLLSLFGTTEDLTALVTWTDMPETAEKAYRRRLAKTVSAVAGTADKSILQMLAQAAKDNLTRPEVVKLLASWVNDKSREVAENEFANAQRYGSLYNAKDVQAQLGVPLLKVWHTSGLDSGSDHKPCPFCEKMNGKSVKLDGTFMPEGASVDIDGETFTNDYVSMETCAAHPHCRCTQTYKVA